MSLTINGATNTLTAASGLAIAGNTAVTGTLSATGKISSSMAGGGRGISLENATDASQTQMQVNNTNGRYEAGVLTSGWSYAGSITAGASFQLYANNTAIATLSSTGLAVTGNISATHASASAGVSIKFASDARYYHDIIGNYSATPASSSMQFAINTGTVNVTSTRLTISSTETSSANPISVSDTTDATSSVFAGNTASLRTAGGLAVAKKLHVGTLLDLSAAAAGQIKFPASQNASVDANTLDDYEEGTWTPVEGGTWSTPTSGLLGRYTKIGRIVHITLEIDAGVKSGTGGYLTGVPFSVAGMMNSVSGPGADTGINNLGLATHYSTGRVYFTLNSFTSQTSFQWTMLVA